MKKFNNNFTLKAISVPFALLVNFLFLGVMISCEKTELPETGSIADLTPPSASFSAVESDDFLIYNFSNTSKSATDYTWDFGNAGASSTEKEPSYTYPAEGVYTVTLIATDKLNQSDTFSAQVTVVEPPEPPAIAPEILNGDFNDGQDNWKVSTFTGGTTSPFNSSSDGENLNYDGSDNGSKTAGAKWTGGTSAGPNLSGSTRFAYQALTVSPGRDYVLEYSYSVKTGGAGLDSTGDRVVVEILDGHFNDGVDALASSVAGPILQHVGDAILGKGNFTFVRQTFTANDSGLVSIWMYGVTSVDAYIDNVKVYPAQ
ncbi:MAG: hypothetical protein DA394_06060 [Candidatus Arcticimaribacter sp.]|nr:MAG: hypothetical protein DA394_06060 [Candidatus Arcticimaribacter sp.]